MPMVMNEADKQTRLENPIPHSDNIMLVAIRKSEMAANNLNIFIVHPPLHE